MPLVGLDLSGNEECYLTDCIRSGWVSSAGEYVTRLEAQVAELTGQAAAVATANGTSALYLLLKSMNIGAGDRVAVADWTFAATANAVIHAGAEPVFVDICEEDWSLDPDLLNLALAETPCKAVIMVDPAGLPANADAIAQICRDYDVPLIEDAAGSIGSRYHERPCGALGDAAIFSFNGNKLVTGGGGGVLVSNRTDWTDRARHLSTQARVAGRYQYDAVGFNMRLTNVNAAIAVAQMERLTDLIHKRQSVNTALDEALAGRDDMMPIRVPDGVSWNGWMYLVRTASPEDGDALVEHLNAMKVQARTFWESLSAQGPYAHWQSYDNGVSRALSGTTITLPNHPALECEDVDCMIDALSTWRGHPVEVRV